MTQQPAVPGQAQGLSARIARGDVLCGKCPSRAILKHVTSQWGVLVFLVLLRGTRRFSELRRSIGGVSEKMLAQTLRTLERDGFVQRNAHPVVPPHVDYGLTPLGREAGERVQTLVDWIEGNLEAFTAQSGSAVGEGGAGGGPVQPGQKVTPCRLRRPDPSGLSGDSVSRAVPKTVS